MCVAPSIASPYGTRSTCTFPCGIVPRFGVKSATRCTDVPENVNSRAPVSGDLVDTANQTTPSRSIPIPLYAASPSGKSSSNSSTTSGAPRSCSWRNGCRRRARKRRSGRRTRSRNGKVTAVRILLWSELYWPYIGGAEIFAANLMSSLRREGIEFLVITSHHDRKLPDGEVHDGITIRRLPFRSAIAGRDAASFVRALKETSAIKRDF